MQKSLKIFRDRLKTVHVIQKDLLCYFGKPPYDILISYTYSPLILAAIYKCHFEGNVTLRFFVSITSLISHGFILFIYLFINFNINYGFRIQRSNLFDFLQVFEDFSLLCTLFIGNL